MTSTLTHGDLTGSFHVIKTNPKCCGERNPRSNKSKKPLKCNCRQNKKTMVQTSKTKSHTYEQSKCLAVTQRNHKSTKQLLESESIDFSLQHLKSFLRQNKTDSSSAWILALAETIVSGNVRPPRAQPTAHFKSEIREGFAHHAVNLIND